MALEILSTRWIITYAGPNDDNLKLYIEIDRENNALSGLPDYAIVDFIRDQLSAHTGSPVAIEKIEQVRTTE